MEISSYSQSKNITLSLKNVTVEKVLNEIERSSEYYFLLNQKLIDINRKVDITVDKMSINDVLSEIFKGQDVDYLVYDRQIVLTPKSRADIFKSTENLQEIIGTVKDFETEYPIPGISIKVEGTNLGGITDFDGNFSIITSNTSVYLSFSIVGYQTQRIALNGRTTIDVLMVKDVKNIEEIIVVGYGTQKKRESTSSIVKVKSEDFNKGNVTSPAQLIQGKVAGLSISKPGGNPNASYDIRLRGLSTIGANTSPLVVIDGVIGGSLENVDPNDIESINVLKDASASAIYGSRAASGVILVTTKKGKQGISIVEYNGYIANEMIAKSQPVMDATEWRALSAEVGKGTDFGANTNWFDETTQNAFSQSHNLSLSGGTKKLSCRASINYREADGVMITSGYKQFSGRMNLNQKAFKDKLTLDLNMGATQRESQYGFDDAFRYATIFNPTAPVRSSDPAYAQYDGYFQQILYDYYNPVQILEQNVNEGKDKLYNLSLRGAFEIIKGLSIDAFYSLQGKYALNGKYWDKNSLWVGKDKNGLAERNTNESKSALFETTAKYNGSLNESVNMSALGGYSYQESSYEAFSAKGGDFLTDAFTYNNLEAGLDFKNGLGEIKSKKNSNKLIAFFGRVNLNINSTWFVMASARYEGSSKFGANNKWGLFPAFGAGLELANFFNVDFIGSLKIRGNYGVTGNQPNDSYISLLRLGPSGNFFYNGSFGPAYSPVSNANKDLKWEKQAEMDFGFDFSIFKSKISGSFDFYTRTSTDILFEYDVPSPPNLYNKAWLNMGEIKSSGLELTIMYNVVQKSDFSYRVSFTPSYIIENTLVSLSGNYNGIELTYGTKDLGGMGAPGQSAVPLIRAEEGKPIGQILTQVFQEIDQNGNLILVNTNGDVDIDGKPIIDTKDRQIVGQGLPNFECGFGNDFVYKNFDMNIFFRGVFGHDLVNSYRGFYEVPQMIGSYNLPKTAKDIRNANGTLLNNSSGVLNSSHVENANFVSLDIISMGYNFKLRKDISISKIRVYLAGNNLFFITKYKGVDPTPRYKDIEDNDNVLVPGIDRRNTWFRTRSVSFGVNIVF